MPQQLVGEVHLLCSNELLYNEVQELVKAITGLGIYMKLISWNVNGLRACIRKGFLDYFKETKADIFCVQEIKLQEGQIDLKLNGYYQYWNYAVKKGYSGTAVFTKEKPLTVQYGLLDKNEQEEGRILTLEFPAFFLVNVYTPNAQRDLARLPDRLLWEDQFFKHITKLDKTKPVVICGDFNVAHQEIDLRNYKTNHGNSGFTIEERKKMSQLLEAGFIDTLRYFYPDKEGLYTWWSYMKTVRERNIGWRIDYFLVSERIIKYVDDAWMDASTMGSDHCPIGMTLNTYNKSP